MFQRKKKFAERLRDLFRVGLSHDETLDELEDLMLEADLGSRLSREIMDSVRQDLRDKKLGDREDLVALVESKLSEALRGVDLAPDPGRLSCHLFLGVNGVGKTTSIAKYAHYLGTHGYSGGMVLAAGDTFRAAASEQLGIHGQRLGLRVVSQGSGADPAAVLFDALDSAKSRGEKLVIADTAGRLHNKAHLVKELEKVDKIVRQKIGDASLYKKILVIDATTGQNGLEQARVFHEAVCVDAVILSKYDSSARGGIAVSLCRDIGLGIAFLGTGESYADLGRFEPREFAHRLLDREV